MRQSIKNKWRVFWNKRDYVLHKYGVERKLELEPSRKQKLQEILLFLIIMVLISIVIGWIKTNF